MAEVIPAKTKNAPKIRKKKLLENAPVKKNMNFQNAKKV